MHATLLSQTFQQLMLWLTVSDAAPIRHSSLSLEARMTFVNSAKGHVVGVVTMVATDAMTNTASRGSLTQMAALKAVCNC